MKEHYFMKGIAISALNFIGQNKIKTLIIDVSEYKEEFLHFYNILSRFESYFEVQDLIFEKIENDNKFLLVIKDSYIAEEYDHEEYHIKAKDFLYLEDKKFLEDLNV